MRALSIRDRAHSFYLPLLGLTVGLASAPAAAATVEDYARAERFLSWNKERYVRNADLQHHWIGEEDRFWYQRTNKSGEKECVAVEAATGKQISASLCDAAPAGAAVNEALSPDGKWAAYSKDHNVWIRPTAGGASFALTTDGIEHYDYASLPGISTHPVSDLRHSKPTPPQVLWSPDSRFLFTYRLDERLVKDLSLIQSMPEDGSLRPKLYTYRYAMPGDEHLPQLEPVVLDIAARRKISLATAPLFASVLTLLEKHEAWWSADDRHLYFLRRDRFSRSVSLNEADPFTGGVREVIQETGNTMVHTNASNIFSPPLVRTLKNGDVIWHSQREGCGHLYYYDRKGTLRRQITRGNWVVRDIVHLDEARMTIYFTASGRESGRDPYEQYLYSIQFDGSRMRLLTPERADHQSPPDRFSPSGRYFVDSYSRPDMPPVFVLRAANGRLVKRLEEADISKLRTGGYTPVEPFEVLAADGKTSIYGNLFRPSAFDPTQKYPVIDALYPGPQMIRTRKSFTAALFDDFEAQSLAELGFIVVTIDGRGTPNRSKAFLDHSYGRMDKASDLDDHIAGIRQLAQRYPYLDLKRVGVDGASGGGYAAAHAIFAYPDFYKVAVAAEGVHDLRGYLAPWGESYQGPVQESDYEVASNLPLAANLKGKLLLMHGELDDNVSPALTMKLVDALIGADKDFALLILPNADHDAFMSPYFIRRKWDYFVRNLLGVPPPAHYSIDRPQ